MIVANAPIKATTTNIIISILNFLSFLSGMGSSVLTSNRELFFIASSISLKSSSLNSSKEIFFNDLDNSNSSIFSHTYLCNFFLFSENPSTLTKHERAHIFTEIKNVGFISVNHIEFLCGIYSISLFVMSFNKKCKSLWIEHTPAQISRFLLKIRLAGD